MKEHAPRGVWLKGASVLVGLSMAAGMTLTQVGTANAQTVVGANISGTGSGNPLIECSWIVGDHNAAGGSETNQINFATGGGIIDPGGAALLKNLTLAAGTSGYVSGPTAPSFGTTPVGTSFVYGEDGPNSSEAGPACTNTSSGATMAAGTSAAPTPTGVSFSINPFDSATASWVSDPGPAPKRVELWAAVDYATSVTFDVNYPDGAPDTEVGGVATAPAGNNACLSNNTSGSLLNSMFAAAGPGEDNELSAAAITNNSNGIVDVCNEGTKQLWHQAFTISKDDPSGLYSVEVNASSLTGSSISWFSFTVSPSIDLATDFSSVYFASDSGNYEINGDTNYSPTGIACDQGASTLPTFASPQTICGAPTVINGGNEGLMVGIAYGALTTSNPAPASNYLLDGAIFDANLAYTTSYLLGTDPVITAPNTLAAGLGAVVYITNNPGAAATKGQLVCPNADPTLDLSLHPGTSSLGVYTGQMEVTAIADSVVGAGKGGCLTDNGEPYIIAGAYKSVTDDDNPALTRF